MRWFFALVLVAAVSLAASGYPYHAYLDLPGAVTLGDPGQSYLQIALRGSKLGFILARAIGQRIDLWATITLENPFSLAIRAALLQDFGPLSVAINGSHQGLQLTASLMLGPVRIDGGRTIAGKARRWGIISATVDQHVTLILGLERVEERMAFLGGLRLFPKRGTFAGSLLLRDRRLTLTVGGFF